MEETTTEETTTAETTTAEETTTVEETTTSSKPLPEETTTSGKKVKTGDSLPRSLFAMILSAMVVIYGCVIGKKKSREQE